MKIKSLLLFIIIVASLFRIYNLESVPPSPSLDEVSIGYNAFSILKTGADEFGEKFPVLLRAYDDWRPALYVYFVIPFVELFGLGILAVRFPSAILGISTVLFTYLLAKELFRKNGEEIGLISALFLAISPWHIYLTRLGHEVNLALAFLVFAIFFFIKFVNNISKNKNYFLYISFVFFALSFNSYQSSKIVVPLMVFVLLTIFLKDIINKKKEILIASLLAFVVTLPIIISLFSPNALIRFESTNIFFNSRIKEISAKQILEDKKNNDMFGQIIHNRRVGYALFFTKAYFSHLNPFWLLFNREIPGGEQFKIPYFGLLNFFEFPLIILGILFLFARVERRILILILSWIFIAILPGALTIGSPHAMRIFNIFPSLQILAGIGAYYIFIYLKKFDNIKFFATFFVNILILTSFMLFEFYFNIFPKLLSEQFQYGIIPAFQYIDKIEKNYDKVIVSKKGVLSKSYMFYLFYKKIDPSAYLKAGGTISGGYDENHKIGKYWFGDLDIKGNERRILLVNPEEANIKNTYVLDTLNSLNGEKSLYILEREKLIPKK